MESTNNSNPAPTNPLNGFLKLLKNKQERAGNPPFEMAREGPLRLFFRHCQGAKNNENLLSLAEALASKRNSAL